MISLLTFFVPFIWKYLFHWPQDLKKKYDAQWALVTGSSSGIGKALAEILCEQGLNVVMVAKEDDILQASYKELKERFPKVEIRCVGADLSKEGYMEKIVPSTNDILISIILNNAGYITTGMFADVPLPALMANYECNATCAVRITHHFLNRLLDQGRRGFIGFTSSPAGCMPSPFASIYGCTKALLTEFATSLAPEVRSHGVDVTVVHPSPVASRFYEKAHRISALAFFQKTGTGPRTIARFLVSNAGRTVIAEQGYYCVAVRGLILKLLDVGLLADIMARFAHLSADFKQVDRQARAKRS